MTCKYLVGLVMVVVMMMMGFNGSDVRADVMNSTHGVSPHQPEGNTTNSTSPIAALDVSIASDVQSSNYPQNQTSGTRSHAGSELLTSASMVPSMAGDASNSEAVNATTSGYAAEASTLPYVQTEDTGSTNHAFVSSGPTSVTVPDGITLTSNMTTALPFKKSSAGSDWLVLASTESSKTLNTTVTNPAVSEPIESSTRAMLSNLSSDATAPTLHDVMGMTTVMSPGTVHRNVTTENSAAQDIAQTVAHLTSNTTDSYMDTTTVVINDSEVEWIRGLGSTEETAKITKEHATTQELLPLAKLTTMTWNVTPDEMLVLNTSLGIGDGSLFGATTESGDIPAAVQTSGDKLSRTVVIVMAVTPLLCLILLLIILFVVCRRRPVKRTRKCVWDDDNGNDLHLDLGKHHLHTLQADDGMEGCYNAAMDDTTLKHTKNYFQDGLEAEAIEEALEDLQQCQMEGSGTSLPLKRRSNNAGPPVDPKTRFSMGPVSLQDENASTKNTYDNMYTHNTFKELAENE